MSSTGFRFINIGAAMELFIPVGDAGLGLPQPLFTGTPGNFTVAEADILDAGGGGVFTDGDGNRQLAKTFTGTWEVWFALPPGNYSQFDGNFSLVSYVPAPGGVTMDLLYDDGTGPASLASGLGTPVDGLPYAFLATSTALNIAAAASTFWTSFIGQREL